MQPDFDLTPSVEKILSRHFGKSIVLTAAQRLTDPQRRSAVYRCTAADGRTWIVKKAPEGAFSVEDRASPDVRRFFADWVGAEFLSSLPQAVPVGPQFYGGDPAAGFFVIQDLGEHRSLVDPLLHGDPGAAQPALLKYAACLGKLHALTMGKAGAFAALYSARLPGQVPPAFEQDELEARIPQVRLLLERLGVAVNGALLAEIQGVIAAVNQPGPFLAYIHADPCPDNVFDLGDHFRLIDFETGHFGHALLDGVYPRMLWPSCWCANRLPGAVVARMESVYRAELLPSCPQAGEDALWETALVNLCALVILFMLAFDLEDDLKADHNWGIATMWQRDLARLEVFITTAEEFRRLPALRGAASQILPRLQKEWSASPPLPLYPAFASK